MLIYCKNLASGRGHHLLNPVGRQGAHRLFSSFFSALEIEGGSLTSAANMKVSKTVTAGKSWSSCITYDEIIFMWFVLICTAIPYYIIIISNYIRFLRLNKRFKRKHRPAFHLSELIPQDSLLQPDQQWHQEMWISQRQ